ncbi:MAG: hypothetical protein AAGD10_07605 [Myxococcota bacterium]
MGRLLSAALLLAACTEGPPADPWLEAKGAFEAARSKTPDYTDHVYDPVLALLDAVPFEHPERFSASALARALRSERVAVERTGLALMPGPPIEVEVELIETETSSVASATSSTTPP